jgi:glucose uptake protein GlcU
MVIVSGPVFSDLSLAFTVLTVVLMGFVYAPQEWKRDKRVIVGFLLVLAAVVGHPLYAFPFDPIVCRSEWWWLFIECYL